MAKEEKNKFQLNKGTDHGFDISKGGKRKFDLTKDTDEPVVVSKLETGVSGGKEKSSKRWLWIMGIIILVVLLALWLWPSSTTSEVIDKETVEEVTAPADETTDTVTNVTTTSEDQTDTNVSGKEEVNAETNPVATSSAPNTTSSSPVAMPATTATISNDIEAEAFKVIRGDYGVGQERKERLGSQYQAIQKRVNELKREGVF